MFSKKYFQDRPILFLNLVVVLGALINVIYTVVKILDASQSTVIIRYQIALGLAGYQRGDIDQLYSFAIAAVLIAVVGMLISARLYFQRRQLSLLILSLSLVALLFNLIVSWSILNLL